MIYNGSACTDEETLDVLFVIVCLLHYCVESRALFGPLLRCTVTAAAAAAVL